MTASREHRYSSKRPARTDNEVHPDAQAASMIFCLRLHCRFGAASEATISIEQFRLAGIDVNNIVENKSTFVLSVYRNLTANQAKLFDQCLIIRAGMPALEIVQPKKRGKKPVNAGVPQS